MTCWSSVGFSTTLWIFGGTWISSAGSKRKHQDGFVEVEVTKEVRYGISGKLASLLSKVGSG